MIRLLYFIILVIVSMFMVDHFLLVQEIESLKKKIAFLQSQVDKTKLEQTENGYEIKVTIGLLFVVGAIAEELQTTKTNAALGFGVPPRYMMARIVKYSLTEDVPVLGPLVDALNEATKHVLCAFCLWLCDCVYHCRYH